MSDDRRSRAAMAATVLDWTICDLGVEVDRAAGAPARYRCTALILADPNRGDVDRGVAV